MQFSDIIKVPFGYVLEWLYKLTNSYGMALILFAVAIKLILLPLSMKSKKSMMKMSRLAPRLKLLEIKYGNDKNRYQQEVMSLYKKEHVSPTGGCLWSFIPLLILIPLYQVIREPMVYMMHMNREEAGAVVEAVKEFVDLGSNTYYHQMAAAGHLGELLPQILSAHPELVGLGIEPMNFSFLGINLGQVPVWRIWTLSGWAAIGLSLIPVASGLFNWLSMFIGQKLNNSIVKNDKGEVDKEAVKANGSMKFMNFLMPIMSIFIGYQMPGALSIYWISQAVFGALQDWALTKYYRRGYDAEDEQLRQEALEKEIREAEKEKIRAERRAKMGDVVDPNTSKKKLAAKEKAEHGPSIEGKLTPEQREALKNGQTEESGPLSGIEDRPFCRGRGYKSRRYGTDTIEVKPEDYEDEPAAGETKPEKTSGKAAKKADKGSKEH